MYDLSILICSLHRRGIFLDRLKNILKPQVNNRVEVLCSIDDGRQSIGAKRQKLLEDAQGNYIAYIDDDDLVSSDYVDLVLKSIDKGPDVIGIHLIMKTDGKLSGKTYHSLKYNTWFDEPGDEPSWRYYYRNPNHLNPVKRELALKSGFPGISMGEDRQYSNDLLPYLETEEYIESPIYTYEVRSVKIV
jgi:glycosyltransferase involved in cell wall biosynthesis